MATKQTTTSHLKPQSTKIPQHMGLEIQALDWDRYKNVAGLNLSM
jgi:hypothetical protein